MKDLNQTSGLLLGSEPLKDVRHRSASASGDDDRKDSPLGDKGDDDGRDGDVKDSDSTDKKDSDGRDSDGRD